MNIYFRPLEATDAEGGMPVGRDSMLVLHNVTYRQQGSYRCTASNTIGGRERWHTADPVTMAVVRIIAEFLKQLWNKIKSKDIYR